MLNILEICESYEGGVKTHLNKLSEYMMNDKDIKGYFWVSGKRTKNKIPNNFTVKNSLSTLINPIKQLKNIRDLKGFIKKNRIDIVHAHSTYAAILLFLYCTFNGKKVKMVYTPHAYFSEKKMSRLKLALVIKIERILVKQFNKVIHVSNEEEKHGLDNKIVKKENSTVIYNGIDNELIQQKPVEKNEKVVINIARVDEQKNPKAFIEFAENYLEKVNTNVKFIYIGDGPLLEECRNLVCSLGLSKNIEFLGYRTDVRKYLEKSRLYFSTARYEGLPYSVLEAMSIGLPVILTNVIGHRELVVGNGYLIDTKKEFFKAIGSILEDTTNKMGQNSVELCLKRYVNEENYLKIIKLYKSL